MYQCFAQESGMIFSSLQLHVDDNRWIKSKGESRNIFLKKKREKTPNPLGQQHNQSLKNDLAQVSDSEEN